MEFMMKASGLLGWRTFENPVSIVHEDVEKTVILPNVESYKDELLRIKLGICRWASPFEFIHIYSHTSNTDALSIGNAGADGAAVDKLLRMFM